MQCKPFIGPRKSVSAVFVMNPFNELVCLAPVFKVSADLCANLSLGLSPVSFTPFNRLMVLPCVAQHYKACLMGPKPNYFYLYLEGSWLGRFWGAVVLQSSWTSGSHQRGDRGVDGGGGRVKKRTKKRRQMGQKEQETVWDKVIIKGGEDKGNWTGRNPKMEAEFKESERKGERMTIWKAR